MSLFVWYAVRFYAYQQFGESVCLALCSFPIGSLVNLSVNLYVSIPISSLVDLSVWHAVRFCTDQQFGATTFHMTDHHVRGELLAVEVELHAAPETKQPETAATDVRQRRRRRQLREVATMRIISV